MKEHELMKEYRVIWQYYRVLGGKAAIFLGAGFPALYKLYPLLCIPYFGIFIVGVFLAIADIYEQQIFVHPRGIEYYGIGFGIEVDWKNIIQIDTDLLLGEEGLYANKSHVVPKTRYFNLNPYKGFRENFFIPLARFQNNWRDSELGQQIKQYAPHLFEKEKSA